MTNPVILTGVRANNELTLGNYFGAILPIIDMAKSRSTDYQINMFIPDLHSFTTPIDHSELYDQIMHNARVFTAAGLPLNNDNIHLYRQSYVPAHSELTWILDCFTGFGEMSRMTQFKDKSTNLGDERVSVGLFNYPVLMAADILLYNAAYIPVGEDQTQHLEYARDIAERMNKKFGDILTIPEPVAKQHEFFGKDQGLRIKDLVDPTKKMSKSDESGRGVIFLSDTPEAAAKKVMSATTDDFAEIRFDRKERPGISNLLEILALLRNQPLTDVIAEFEGQTRYGDFKKVVADEVADFLRGFQLALSSVDDMIITSKLESSERAMNTVAQATLLRVQQAVGLRPKKG
jgi:tryptophanyl-tRNA synthetase